MMCSPMMRSVKFLKCVDNVLTDDEVCEVLKVSG